MSGSGAGEPLEVSDSVPVGAEVGIGDILVTSGLDRSLYPEGLIVGTVTEIVVDEAGLDQQLVVEPTARLERLDFVTVVLFDPEAPQADAGEGSG